MTAPTPPPGPTSVEQVAALTSGAVPADAPGIAEAVAATNALVSGWLSPPVLEDGTVGEWDARHRYGATLLALRFHRRKDSPGGSLPFGLENGATYVASNWPDVAMLLELGSYTRPAVG